MRRPVWRRWQEELSNPFPLVFHTRPMATPGWRTKNQWTHLIRNSYMCTYRHFQYDFVTESLPWARKKCSGPITNHFFSFFVLGINSHDTKTPTSFYFAFIYGAAEAVSCLTCAFGFWKRLCEQLGHCLGCSGSIFRPNVKEAVVKGSCHGAFLLLTRKPC